ncbi:alpha/beta hydrolase [Brachybacterium sp. DNPG3]
MNSGIVSALRALASQQPTRPPRRVADAGRVRRGRAGHVPVTWIDPELRHRGVLLHLHGGAFTHGETRAHWEWLEEVARRSGVAGAMLHYRMPPAHPFPQAVEDVAGAILALDREIALPGGWVLSGDEAGAALALAGVLDLAESDGPLPARLLLSAPWVDLVDEERLDERRRVGARLYAGAVPREDVRLSPLHADLAGLPPVHLSVGGDDPLASDARRLRGRLLEAGVDVEYYEESGLGDGYPMVRTGAAAQRAWRAQIVAVREALGR